MEERLNRTYTGFFIRQVQVAVGLVREPCFPVMPAKAAMTVGVITAMCQCLRELALDRMVV